MWLWINPYVWININKENKEYLNTRNNIINILFLWWETHFNRINNWILLKLYIAILRKKLITEYGQQRYNLIIKTIQDNNLILNNYNYNKQIKNILIKYKADNDSQAKWSLNKLLSTSWTNNKDSVNSNNLNSQEWKQLVNLAKKIIEREFELYKILLKK